MCFLPHSARASIALLAVSLGALLAIRSQQVVAAENAAAFAMVRPDHHALIKVDIAAILNSKLVKGLPMTPEEIVKNLHLRGPDGKMAQTLLDVELLCVSIGPRAENAGGNGPPVGLGVYARFKSPEALQTFVATFERQKGEAATHNGKEYFKPKRPDGPVLLISGQELYIATDEPTIHQVIDSKDALVLPPLVKKLAGVNLAAPIVVAGSLGSMKPMVVDEAKRELKGSPLEGAAELPGQLDWGVLAIDLEGEKLIDVDADMENEPAAEKLKAHVDELLKMAKAELTKVPAEARKKPEIRETVELAELLLGAITVERNGKHVDLTLTRTKEFEKLPEILGRAVKEARESAKSAMAQMTAMQLRMAMQHGELATGKKPGNIADAAGKPLLSWRVAILPYIEAGQVFDQIRRDEAWDSEHNRRLADKMPPFFKTESAAEANTTTWRLLPANAAGMKIIDAGKGAAVAWMQPDELKIDPEKPLASLGEAAAKGYPVAFEDGHVERVSAERFAAAFKKPAGP